MPVGKQSGEIKKCRLVLTCANFIFSKEKTEKKFAALRLFLACLIEQGEKDSRSAADIVRLIKKEVAK